MKTEKCVVYDFIFTYLFCTSLVRCMASITQEYKTVHHTLSTYSSKISVSIYEMCACLVHSIKELSFRMILYDIQYSD